MTHARKHAWRRRIGAAGAAALLGVAAFAAWRLGGGAPQAKHSNMAEAAVPVIAAKTVRKDFPNIIDTIGTVQPIDEIAVESQASGPIVKIEFSPGEEVKKGQELFLIDPRPYQAALDQAQAQLKHDEAVLQEAEMDLERYQKLERENSIASQQAQDEVYVVEGDKGAIQVDQANVDAAKINLGYCHITAPATGRAGVLQVDLGNLVGPSSGSQGANRAGASTSSATSGQTSSGASASGGGQAGAAAGLVTIAQMKPIYVNFSIAQTMLGEVRRNQAQGALEVDAFAQSGKLVGRGKLAVIDNQVDASTGTVTMQGVFPNSDEALWPGEFVSVELVVSTRRNVVTAPAQAVMVGASGSYAYVIGPDGVVRRVDVEVAARRRGVVAIAKGLDEGEKVVVDGQYRLANGVKVVVRQTSEAKLVRR